MTTVVYDARTREMVSDTQMSLHKTAVDKIYRLDDNSLVGVSGTLSEILLMIDYLNTPEGEAADKPSVGENNYLLRVDQNNDVFLYTSALIGVQLYGAFHAIGSGSDYAMGAMAQGATAEEALAIAHMFDESTGPQTVRVEL